MDKIPEFKSFVSSGFENISLLSNMESLKNSIQAIDPQTEDTQLSLIMLNIISDKYYFNTIPIDKLSEKTKLSFQKLIKKICLDENVYNNSPLLNADNEFNSLKISKDKNVNALIEIARCSYVKKQINFIKEFYTKILESNFYEILGKTNGEKVLEKEGWKKDKTFIIIETNNRIENFGIQKNPDLIKYLDEKNVGLECIVKKHQDLVNFQNK